MRLMPPVKERLEPSFCTSWKDMRIYLGRYAFAGARVKNKVALDVACGTGYGTSFLLRSGAARAVGIDLSMEAVRYAASRYPDEMIDFFRADAQHLPLQGSSFDVVVSMETIEHLSDYETFLQECQRILRRGGMFVCSTPNREGYIIDPGRTRPFHTREFTQTEFRDLLGRYFGNVLIYGYIRAKHEGAKEKLARTSAVILHRLPRHIHSASLRLLGLVTRFAWRDYHPVKMEDLDHRDFASLVDQGFMPFDLAEATPQYLMGIAQKQNGS